MRAPAGTSLLVAAALSLQARAEPAPAPEVESLVREAAGLEAADSCEQADLLYRQAGEQLARVVDPGRRAQLKAIVGAKRQKLDPCFDACQPAPAQQELLATARASAGTEPRRAARILRQLLVGHSAERCRFWSEARTLLRTLPGQADDPSPGSFDPCSLSPELSRTLDETRKTVQRERAAARESPAAEAGLSTVARLTGLDELSRAMDDTRVLLAELHEGLLDCDVVARGLAEDSTAILQAQREVRESAARTAREEIVALGERVRAGRARLAKQDAELARRGGEEAQLRARLEGLSQLSDQVYGDLSALAQAESAIFPVEVEGRRVDPPLDEIRAIVADEKRTLDVLSRRFPDAFRDGVSARSLREKRAVLDRLGQALRRYASRPERRLGQERTLAELDATLQLIDAALARHSGPAEQKGAIGGGATGLDTPWLLAGGGLLGAAGLTLFRLQRSRRGH